MAFLLFTKFVKEEKGAPIIQVVMLIAISALIAAFLFPTLRDNLGQEFNDMVVNMTRGIGGTTSGAVNTTPPGTINNGAW
jgi:Flp pilus assembly pilin Flp